MTETPPPSWRDVANGRFEVDPKPLPTYDDEPVTQPLAAAPAAAPVPAPDQEAHGGSGRTVAAVLVTALVAGGAGFAVGTLDPLGLQDDDSDLRAAELSSRDADLAGREQALTEEQQELAKAQRKLRKRERKATARAKALDGRAAAVQAAEQALAEQEALADSVVGDGVFEVGVDVAPGTWTSSGGSDSCTWVVRTAEDGGDVVTEESVAGGAAAEVTLADDLFFETSGCGDWSLG
ncbi:hypothetical protein [Nocardioides solisilvae]|uniref:hypothetical protein n=1 Tax=Nocardioides solisilvae TaxID=1542435 RepID=UPI000D74180F|nr:hypothetical protein [Nocardioides solisilvae]